MNRHRSRPARLAQRAGNVVLSLTACLGLVSVLALLAAMTLGIEPIVFRSGSMSPAVEAGALGLAREVPPDELRTGDVVSVQTSEGAIVTHRIVTVTHHDNLATLRLQGDANSQPDADLYQVGPTPRLMADVPWVGFAVAWLGRSPGILVLAGFAAVMMLLVLRGGRAGHSGPPAATADRPGKPKSRRAMPRGRGAALTLSLTVVLASGFGVTPGWAAFSDTAPVSGTTMSTWTVPKPVIAGCTITGNALTGFTATIVWPGAAGPSGQSLDYTAVLRETNAVLSVSTSGSQRQTQVTSGLLGSLFGTVVHVDIRASTAGWTSVAATQNLTVGALGASLACSGTS